MPSNQSSVPRLLFLAINFENWVAPTIFCEQQAIQRLMPQSVFYGPGYRYETNHVQGIVEEVFGHNLPDAIFCYVDERRLLGEPLPQEIVSRYNIKPSLRVFPHGLKDIKVPKIAWINDFWHCSRDEWEEILLGNGFEMAFATYAPPFTSEDIFGQFFSQRVRESVKFVPWPRAIHPAVFRDFGLEKIYDVSLLGARDAAFYPLREKMHETFSRQKKLAYFSQSHPGYNYHATGTALTGEAYARVINQSKIFASCTGRYNIPFIKLYEVLACRTLLMCDRPSGAEYLGLMDGENYIAISQDNFLEKASCLLSDRILIDRIANEANALFLSRHTVDVRAREFVKTVHAGLQGKTAEGWASLYPIRKGGRSLTAGSSSVACPAKHIREICSTADETALIIWNKYGVNNRLHETPPVVTEHPELVVLRGVYLRQLAERIGAKHFAEIGTARGFQSFMWAQYLLETSPDGLVYTCDIDGMDQPIYKTPLTGDRIFTRRQLWQGSPQARIVRFVHGNSHKLAQEIEHELDLVFIDGEHSEEAVLRDFTALLPNLHPGTIVVFDDCDDRFPGVQRAVKHISGRLNIEAEIIDFTPSPYKIAVIEIPSHIFEEVPARSVADQRSAPTAPKFSNKTALSPGLLGSDFVPRIVKQEGENRIVAIGDLQFRLHPGRYLDRGLIEGSLFEADSIRILDQIIRHGQTVVDVGANFGYYTLLLSRWVGSTGQVIAFEPTREYGLRNQAHLRDNRIYNVHFEPCGLSDYDHTADIQIGECSGTMHWTAPSSPRGTETIRLIRFDDWWNRYVAEGKPDRLDFLKIDVDGHELHALRGARETLRRHRPILLVEFYKPNFEQAGYTCADLADFLERELGYKLCNEQTGKLFEGRVTFLATVDRPDLSVNVFCIPAQESPAADMSLRGEIFISPAELYLASADRMDHVLSNLRELKSLPVKQIDTYASVIGGLSGLNYLLAFDPRAIVFFDINPGMVAYARLIKAMIGLSETPEEFISRIFCRSVETYLSRTREKKLTCENQRGFLSMPVDEMLLSDTLNRLSPEERSTFEAFVAPHLPATTLDGARNCRRLLPCWPIDERVPVGAGEALGTDEKGALVPNTNTFFYGHGWLASKEAYRKVSQTLQDRPVRFMSFDLLRDDWHLLSSLGERFVLHISNVDDWFPEAWKERAQALDRRVVEVQGLCWVVTSHNGIRRPAADPHTYAYAALAPYACGEVVEVTHKVPWGFHEIDRVNISADDYLRRDYPSDATILHILLGEGISRDCFEQVLRKALDCSERVIILEHNAESSDWTAEQSKRFIREEHLHETVKQCLHGSSFKLSRILHLAGERDLRRNLLVILDRDTAEVRKGNRPAAQTGRNTICARGGSPVEKSRPRILLIADVPNWIFARHCRMFQRYLGSEFDFTIKVQGEPFREDDFDLIYPLEWNLVQAGQIGNPRKYITGIRSHVWWPDLNFANFTQFLATHFQRVHVVSKRLLDIFEPALLGVIYVTHGVDTKLFTSSTRTDQSGKKLRLGWAGNRNQPAKGFKEFVEPLGEIPGVELVFCGYADRNLSMEEMRAFYDSLDAYICASSNNEGNNNSLLEAAAMKRAIITTDNGTVPEYLIDGKNALIVSREREAFVQAVEKLRDDPALRMKLGKAARKAVTSDWDWRVRVEDYRRFFREATLQASSAHSHPPARHSRIGTEDAPQRAPAVPQERRYELIQEAINSGKFDKAIAAIETLLLAHPDFAPAHSALGALCDQRGEKVNAGIHYKKAVSLAPTNISFLKHLAGFLLIEEGKTEEALALYYRALKLDPRDVETLLILGNICASQKQYGNARFFYDKVLEVNPGNGNAIENLETLIRFEHGEIHQSDDEGIKISVEDLRKKNRRRKGQEKLPEEVQIPLISVIVPTHNRPEMMKDTIQSILDQTFKDIEIVIVNDGSTDNTNEMVDKLIASLHRCSVKLITTSNSGNPAFLRNRGVCEARGEYILFLDSGDMILPEFLAECLGLLESTPEVSIAYCDYIIFDEISPIIHNVPEYDFKNLLEDNQMAYCSLFRKIAWKDVGGVPTDVGYEDWDFWIMCGEKGHVGKRIPKPLFCYRQQDSGRFNNELVAHDKQLRAELVIKHAYLYSPAKAEQARFHLQEISAQTSSKPLVERRGPGSVISVIVPCYNQAEFLPEAVESLIAQGWTNWECIIVNDGSTDDTSVVARYLIANHRHQRIRLLEKINGGLADARNAGVRASSGEFILFLDADDKIHPRFLEETVHVLIVNPHVGFVYTNVQHFGAQSDVWSGGAFDPQRFLRENQLTCSALFRRRMYDEIGGLKLEMKEGFEDWEFWISGYQKGWLGYLLDKTYFYYRKHPSASMLDGIYGDEKKINFLKARIITLHQQLYTDKEKVWANVALSEPSPFIEKTMTVEILKTRAEIENAREEMGRRGIDCLSTSVKDEFKRNGWLHAIGDIVKSWDVLKTIDLIQKALPKTAPILDIGSYCCEVPCALARLGYLDVCGIDLNPELVRMPYNDRVRYTIGNFMVTPFDDHSFSAITAISVIEHGFDSRKLLTEVSRLLKPGGHFIASVDYWPDKIDTTGTAAFGMDWRIFSKQEILDFIEEAKRYGLQSVGGMDFDARERTIDWSEQQYTFAWLALKKAESAVAASHIFRVIIAHTKFHFSPIGINSGAEMATIHMARQLAAMGIKVTVFGIFTSGSHSIDDVTYKSFTDHDELCKELARTADGADLLLANAVEALQAAANNPAFITRAYWMHAPAESYRDKVGIINHCADAIVHVSCFQMDAAHRVGLIKPGILLYNGFAEEVFFPRGSYNPYQLVYAGALVPLKGVHLLVDAFQKIQQAIPQATLLICGSAAMWGEQPYLDQEQISQNTPGIHFLGAVPQQELSRIFAESAIGVIPTIKRLWQDPFPLTPVEMQACGLPVLVSAAGGLPESIRNGETGFVLDSENADDWANSIIALLRNQELLASIRPNCINHATENFRWLSLVSTFLGQIGRIHIAKSGFDLSSRSADSVNTDSGEKRNVIAFLTTWNQPCGIATHTGYVIDGLRQALGDTGKETRIIVLAEESHDRTVVDDETVFRCWRRDRGDFREAIDIIARENVKILHIQFQNGLFQYINIESFAVECQKRGITLFFTFHSGEERMDLCARLANLSTASFVHLEQNAVRLIEFGALPEKVHVVPHGVIENLEHKMSIGEAKAALNLPADLCIISSFGFFEPHKGIYEIIEAFPEVLARNPNSVFLFLGGCHPENKESQLYINHCRDLSVSLGISDRVIFNCNFIPDEELHRYLQASNVIVMNYTLKRNEASGACAFAMAHRRPLVVSAVPPFMSLSGCTLQTSLGMGIGRAINTILERPYFARYLIDAADEYIRKNSFTVLGANLLHFYGMAEPAHTECTVGEPAHRPISIGIDARTFYYSSSMSRGIGTYTLHLLHNVARMRPGWRFVIFGESDELTPSLRQLLKNHTNCTYTAIDEYLPASVELTHIPDPMNLIPGFDSPFRLLRHERMTVTFHDLIPLHYYIDNWPPELQALYKKRLSELVRSSCTLLANSDYTAKDVIKELGLSTDRITVVHAGNNNLETYAAANGALTKAEVLKKYGITTPYYLYVGTIDPHKNFESAITSFQKASIHTAMQLIVVGKENYLTKTFSDEIERVGIRGIIFTGFVTREELTALYANAIATLFLSRQEGFGFPVLEAMANGCPVIASNTTSIPEVSGDAALLFSPDDIDGVSQAMLKLLHDQGLREDLRRRGYEQSTKFSWEQTARKTIAVWEQMLGIIFEEGHKEFGSKLDTTDHSQQTMTWNIAWHGPQFIYHSLALVSRELCLQFLDSGHRLSLRLTDDTGTCLSEERLQPLTKLVNSALSGPPEVHIYHWYPPNLTPPPEGHWVMIQPWEMGSVPKRWIEVMKDQVDEVWVPTNYVRDCYIKSGMNPERIAVVPNGIDTQLFSPTTIPYPLSTRKKYRFLYVGTTALERKGFDILINAYVQEFYGVDDVCLVVKDMAVYTGGSNPIRKQIADLCRQSGVPEILFLEQDLSSLEQAGLYTGCSCFVHSYRAEGFSLPVAEAMASGLPVIVTGHGACLDFCDETNAYLIPAREVQLSQKQIYGMDTVDYPWWAEPDAQATRSLMRLVYEHPEDAKTKGRIARERIEKGFTWQHAREAAEERLKTITSRPILRFQGQYKTTQWQDSYLQPASLPRRSFSLLFIAPMLPTFDRDSGSFRLYQLLKILREEGHQITFLAQGGAGNFDSRPYQDALETLGIEVVAFDPERMEERTGIRINAPWVDLGILLSTRRFDAAYIYFYFTAAYYLKWLREYSPKTKIIIDSVDFHYLRERRAADLARDTDALRRAEQTLRNELFVYEQADLVVMVTDEDRRTLLGHSAKIKADVIPNIHPTGDEPPPFSARSGIMFVGNFFHTPNTDAVLYLVNEIMPLVRKRLQDIVLTIVGNSPPAQIQAVADRYTRVTGYVEDLVPLLNSHRVSVAPLRFGAGMKGKVGEAMSAGIPVVVSEVAAEGCGFKNGEDILMARNTSEFVDMIIALHTNEAIWTQLSWNGRRTMHDKYSPEALRGSIRAVLSRTIDDPIERLTNSSKLKDVFRPYSQESDTAQSV